MTRRRDQLECQHLAAIEDKGFMRVSGRRYLAWCPTCDYRFSNRPLTSWDPNILTESAKRLAAPTLTCKCCGREEKTIHTYGTTSQAWWWGETADDNLCRRCYDYLHAEGEPHGPQ